MPARSESPFCFWIRTMKAIRRMIGEAKSHPGSVIVSNAVLEQEKTKELWYRTPYHKRQIGNLKTYLTVGIQIISPGQCLPEGERAGTVDPENLDDYAGEGALRLSGRAAVHT